VASSWRTLQFIGWQHAEPVLRSLAFAVLNHELRGTTPAKSDEVADRPWRRNQELAAKIGPEWLNGRVDEGATRDMLAVLREGSNVDTCNKAVELIGRGISPQSIWDALFLEAGELMIRQPAITALHSMTSTNALHYGFQASGDDNTRRLLLLQNCAFVPMFRDAIRGNVANLRIDDVKPVAITKPSAALEEIFSDVSANKMNAAGKFRQYLNDGGSLRDLAIAARRLIFLKGDDAHDYKYSGSVLEDYLHVSPPLRAQFLAASAFYLKGSGDKDNTVVQRTREALKS
jgi:hypothetical protein